MKHDPTVLCVLSLLTLAACGSGNVAVADAAMAMSCTGQEASCSSIPYGACVEIRQGPGRCVDWSTVGASPCTNASTDCSGTLPMASFAGPDVTNPIRVCVKAASIEYALGSATSAPGYCGVVQSNTDSTGAATCMPNPCGPGGYCSYLVNGAGASVVSCLWPI